MHSYIIEFKLMYVPNTVQNGKKMIYQSHEDVFVCTRVHVLRNIHMHVYDNTKHIYHLQHSIKFNYIAYIYSRDVEKTLEK